jgi:hypothetical protein
MQTKVVLAIVLLVVGILAPLKYSTNAQLPQEKFECIFIPSWDDGEYQRDETIESMQEMKNRTGANCVGIMVVVYQWTSQSTTIYHTEKTATDEDIRYVIDKAKDMGLRVFLKMNIGIHKAGTGWHGQACENISYEECSDWFSEYKREITHYAEIAEEENVELFSVGNELSYVAINRPDDWRQVVAEVRQVYSGPLTYSANHGEEVHVQWWDAVDYIGVSAYYRLSETSDPSLQQLVESWQVHSNMLQGLSDRWGKQILLTEIGYSSYNGTTIEPWRTAEDHHTLDLQEQADAYQAMLSVNWHADFVAGVFLWRWSPKMDSGGVEDMDFTPKGKPAEDILRQWWGESPVPTPTQEPYPAPECAPSGLDPELPKSTPEPLPYPQYLPLVVTCND